MADQFDNNKDNDQEQKYEKFCFYVADRRVRREDDSEPS